MSGRLVRNRLATSREKTTMKPTWFASWRALPLWLAALLNGCGGGGNSTSVSSNIGARFLQDSVRAERDVQDRRGVAAQTLSLAVLNSPGGGYFYRYTHTNQAIELVGDKARTADDGIDFQVQLKAPGTLPADTYDDTVRVDLCIDKACTQHAAGSPFVA